MSFDSFVRQLPESALDAWDKQAAEALSLNQLGDYRPYTKQRVFHAMGASHRERLFMAGNQLGKTKAGGSEAAIHATGRYPVWWDGKRFEGPTAGWAAGVTGESTRDNVQRILMGRDLQFGTGTIPASDILGVTAARGVPGLMDTIRIRHISGGVSTIGLKSYEKGRAKWQGETLHWVWFDEEPEIGIYIEGLTRTNATNGISWMTFTPLMGMSDVVTRFLMEKNPDRSVTQMEIGEAEHYTPEKRAQIIASYPEHEREARASGVPVLGSGRVFPITEALIKIDPIPLAPHWPRIAGLDIGWDHPTACVWLAWDRDADILYIYDCYALREATPVIHGAAIKAKGPTIPVAWPHDGLQHDKGSGTQIAKQYRDQGVSMLPERATFEDGTNGVEAGILEMLDRMQTGRLKVFSHLNDWFEEFRLYHRKDGLIVKERDDRMSATRYAVMMKRHAKLLERPKKHREHAGPGGWMGVIAWLLLTTICSMG